VLQLEGCDIGGLLRSIGDDPQLLLQLPEGELQPGTYRLSVELQALDGELGLPRLYFGRGMACTVPLRSRFRGQEWTGIVYSDEVIHALRLDPANREVTFQLGNIVLERLSTVEAVQALNYELSGLLEDVGKKVEKCPLRDDLQDTPAALFARYVGTAAAVVEEIPGGSYAAWIKAYGFDGPESRDMRITAARKLSVRPLLSVLLPVYDTAEKWLRECLDSVRNQAYVDWELCIADDASPSPHIRRILDEYVALDSRIRVSYRERNGHISAASNTALAMACGTFVVLLDHDDKLPANAFYEIVRAIEENPQADLLYSDEDKIDEHGVRFDPYFKPDWNPDLFYSQNFISHLGVYRTGLVRSVGGFREAFVGSQDYDLALRCVAHLRGEQIVHIPRILYHWRAISGSTALALGEKNYAVDAGQRALSEHFQRAEESVKVEPTPGGYRVSRALPSIVPRVELIIPTRDRVDLLRHCVDSILEKTTYHSYRVTIVDNGSVEPETLAYLESVAKDERVNVLRDDCPFNYSRLNNRAAAKSNADIIGLINNDIEVITPGWLEEMVSHAIRPEIGAVGAMLYYPDDRIQHAGVILGMHGVAGHIYNGAERGHTGQMGRPGLVQNLSAVTAACLLVRREIWSLVGGLDETLTVAFNDIDFCLKVRAAGYRNLWTPFAELYHHESATRGYEDTPEKKARFDAEIDAMCVRWGKCLHADPAHNPNLSLYSEAMIPAFPPRDVTARAGGLACLGEAARTVPRR
jgi:GT2 family glycosyltransferase